MLQQGGHYGGLYADDPGVPAYSASVAKAWGDPNPRNDLDLFKGNPDAKNAQFVVQPFYVPENVVRFDAPAGRMTYTFRWQPESAAFQAIRGSAADASANSISQHVFNSGIPQAAGQTVHINLYEFHHSGSALQQPALPQLPSFDAAAAKLAAR